MARYRVLAWRDIPTQVRVTDETGARADRAMPRWFMQEISRITMREGLAGTDAYLAAFAWSDEVERDGAVDEVADALVAELAAAWGRAPDGHTLRAAGRADAAAPGTDGDEAGPGPGPGGRRLPIRLAAPAEIPELAGVLARAFAADPMTLWPLGTADDPPGRIRAMFEIVDTAFAAEGWMHVAAGGLGVMSLLPPGSDDRERAIGEAIAPALAVALTPDGGARYERFWAWIDATIPPEPHWLLDQLAVEPAAQGRGIGGAMLRFAIDRAQGDGLPLILETGVPANVPLYERFGFRVTLEADAPDGGPRIWFMRRDPG